MSDSDGAWCTITFVHGGTVEVLGGMQDATEELHRVATRREHTFAVFERRDGGKVSVRPEAIAEISTGDAA